jgi:galactonate dehydratase
MAAPVIRSVDRLPSGVLRVTSDQGIEGFGQPVPLGIALPVLGGRISSSREGLRAGVAPALWPSLEMACLDLEGRHRKAPVYQLLGGPTRTKVRILTPVEGPSDEALRDGVLDAQSRGAAAFLIPLPDPARARGFTSAVVRRLEALRKAGGDGSDYVLDGRARLTPGEASRIARAVEGLHLLWFDEPCVTGNIEAVRKLADETVTPLGFGVSIQEAPAFQELLRAQVIDVVRPHLSRFGLTEIRRIAVLAEAYYVAVAPICEPHPTAAAASLHLAASLPNFVIQELPLSLTPSLKSGYAGLSAAAGLQS